MSFIRLMLSSAGWLMGHAQDAQQIAGFSVEAEGAGAQIAQDVQDAQAIFVERTNCLCAGALTRSCYGHPRQEYNSPGLLRGYKLHTTAGARRYDVLYSSPLYGSAR